MIATVNVSSIMIRLRTTRPAQDRDRWPKEDTVALGRDHHEGVDSDLIVESQTGGGQESLVRNLVGGKPHIIPQIFSCLGNKPSDRGVARASP